MGLVDRSRRIIGNLDTDVRREAMWDEQSIGASKKEFLEEGKAISLIRIYDHNADIDRQVALRLVAKREQGNALSRAEESELVAAHLRVTLMETLSRAMDAYMDILEQYRSYKNAGMRADPTEEAVVFRHLELVTQVADRRVQLAIDRKQGQTAQNYEQQARVLDNELLRLLAMHDKDIPGYKKDSTTTLPAYDLMLSMLNDEYRKTFDAYKEKARGEGASEPKNRVESATELIARRFPGKPAREIDGKEVDAMLRRELRGYTLDQYQRDGEILERMNRSFSALDARGRETVQRLSDLNMAMGRYQVQRATLASMRHHIDQAYATSGAALPERGKQSDPATVDDTRKFLEQQQEGSLRGLDRHLQLVDEKVLKVGFAEKAETLWNTKARIFLTRVADAFATLETSWIPDVPGLPEGFLRNSARESLLNGELMEDALGWPRDSKGNLIPYGKLSQSERSDLESKQDSIEKAILRFRETNVLRNMQGSVRAAKLLISRKDLAAERFIDARGIDAASLPQDRIDEKNLDQMIQKYTAPVVYKMLFVQLQNDWTAYSAEYATLLGDFHKVIGTHFDVAHFYRDFADGQMDVAKLLLALAFAAGAASVGVAMLIRRMLRGRGGGVPPASSEARSVSSEPKAPAPKPPPTPKASSPSPSPSSVPKAGPVAPVAKLGEELTRVRYATQWEKNLAESLEKTRAMQKYRAFQNVKGVKVAGRFIRYGAGVAIPALAAYEIALNEQRARGASANPDLQKEYRDNHLTTILEATGVGLTLSSRVPFLKALYLGAAVVNTANYRRKRTAVREDWKRETEDYIREFDAPGLLQEIQKKTLDNAVEGGAGSALYPKIVPAFLRDDVGALKLADEATRGARWRAYEAYFSQNLSPDLRPEERKALVKDKTQYIGLVSQNDFDHLSRSELERADLYAELQQRRRAMEEAGQEPVFTYEEDGQVRTIDLRMLTPGTGTAESIRRIVGEYATVMRPMEDLLMFEALTKAGRGDQVRDLLIGRLMHSLHDAERHIRGVDWPGIDTWVSSGQFQSENIVRAYVAMQIAEKIDPLVKRLAQGEASIDEYRVAMEQCHSLVAELLLARDSSAYLSKAQSVMGEERCKRAAARNGQHISGFLILE
jgi:hypothetical protein